MEEDPLGEVIQEVLIGKGLGGALQYLRERGDLKETAVDWGGRNMDKKKSKLVGIMDKSNTVVSERDILLDRVDEFGRTMTPKEAFRRFFHKFHGKEPGKKKQAKRLKQFQEELKRKQMSAGDHTPLMSMDKIRDLQAKLQSPYLVLSGPIKPGQTNDPRNAFSTVKKEPIGSTLTPILGDNKTHFQGIKQRKPESRSVRLPPNKKRKDHKVTMRSINSADRNTASMCLCSLQ